jgi:acetolactate synthase I/II/III large subunit
MGDNMTDILGAIASPAATTDAKPVASRSGAVAICEAMHASGIEYVFGYSGGGTGPLIHEFATTGMKSMNARTEIAGAWMSYGYNRMKGRAASACLFHCVGILHASAAALAAKTDSTPLVLTYVSLDSSLDLREALQDSSEVFPAMKPLAKFARKLVVTDDAPLAVRQAVLAASTGRPGSSVLDFAFQVLVNNTNCVVEPLTLPEPPGATQGTIDKIMAAVRKAKRPIILAGAGVQHALAAQELADFAEASHIPVISTSWGGRGLLADTHPLYGGVMGSFGWVGANSMAQEADLWIAIGTTFSQMTTGAWNIAKPDNVIQIDIDPNQLGKIFQPSLGVVGDAKVVLGQLTEAVRSLKEPLVDKATAKARRDQVAKGQSEWTEYLSGISKEGGNPINQYHVLKKMSDLMPPGTIVVGDSGGQAYMLYRAFKYSESAPMIVGGRYQSLGAGLSIAVGAKLAAPEKTVVCYHGDGGFYYDAMELSTLSERKIKIIVIIDNNHCLYANRQGMTLWGIQNPWVDTPKDVDFVALAKAQGVEGERVVDAADIGPAIERALASEGSYIIDVWTDPDTRIRRAFRDVIPILTDRKPEQGVERHMSPPLVGSWPN